MLKKITNPLLVIVVAFGLSSCQHFYDLLDEIEPQQPKVSEFATGLHTPMGLEMSQHNWLWVAEAGTGNNDGQVSMVTPNGMVYPAIVGFVSGMDPEGNPSGLNNLLLMGDKLYILHGVEDRLYIADMEGFKPGDTPMHASELESHDIGSFVLAYDFGELDANESNPYDLTFGPDGDLFITDASANAIIRRESETGELSVFATFPAVPNPTTVGPPMIDAVPTGIAYDGHRFYVTTLVGFPFPPEEARVYQVDRYGNVLVYQEGFTSLVDVELDRQHNPLVLQFSRFGLSTGFTPNNGRLIRASDDSRNVLADDLNYPTALELIGERKAYVTDIQEGKIMRLNW